MPDLTRAERVEAAARALLQHASHRTWDDLRDALALPPDPQPQTGALREHLRHLHEVLDGRAHHAYLEAESEFNANNPFRSRYLQGCWDTAREAADEIGKLLAAPAPAEPEPVPCPNAAKTIDEAVKRAMTLPAEVYQGLPNEFFVGIPGEPKSWRKFTVTDEPAEPEPVADAERERRVAEGGWSSSIESRRLVSNAMDAIDAPLDDDQMDTVAKMLDDRDAEVARLRALYALVANCAIQIDNAENDNLPSKAESFRDEMLKLLADYAPSGGEFTKLAAEMRGRTWNSEMVKEAQEEVARLRGERDYFAGYEADIQAIISTLDRNEYPHHPENPDRSDIIGRINEMASVAANLRAEVERLTKERDAGWEALERLRDRMSEGLSIVLPRREDAPFLHSMREAWESAIALVDKALAARPAQGKEGA